MINIIVAYDKNGIIGKDGKMPWRIPAESRHFRETTGDCPCIMGRKTWDSLPPKYKPLPDRINIVVTRNARAALPFYDPKEPFWAGSIDHAIRLTRILRPEKDVFIIGGAQIYSDSLNRGLVDAVIASEIDGEFLGDAYFPKLDWPFTIIAEYDQFVVKKFLKPE